MTIEKIIPVRILFLVLTLPFLILPLTQADQAEDRDRTAEEFKKYQFETVTTKEGLRFEVPPDMPIQRKDGLVQPVEFNQYLYVKFKMMEERMGKLEKQISEMQKKIISKLDALKAQEDEISKKISALTPPSQTPSG